MSKEKKPQRTSGSARSSSRGASKRPASPSQSSSKNTSPARKSRARKREDTTTRKRRKTEQAVRKASVRTAKRNSTKRKPSSSTSTQRKISNPRKKSASSTRSKNVTASNRGASVRHAQNSARHKRPAQEVTARKRQPVKKRKPTAAEIARRKRNRRLLLIALLLLAFLIASLFTLHYVSSRIQDQTTVVLNDEQSSFAPVACTPDILSVSMKADAPLDENIPITFTLSLHNSSSDHPCYIDVGRGHTELNITSGDDPIVPLSTCESAGKEYKQLLIDRNMRTSFTVTWNRHRGSECKGDASTALPGVYKAVWKMKGEDSLEAEAIFEVKEPPKPEPTESLTVPEESPQPTEESTP